MLPPAIRQQQYGTETPDDSTSIEMIPVVQTIQDSRTTRSGVFAQSEVPTVTGDILNALRTTGKTLCVVGDGYTLKRFRQERKEHHQ